MPDPTTAPEGADRLTIAVTRAATTVAALGTARPLTAPEGADDGPGTATGPGTAAQAVAATATADRLTLSAPTAATSVAAVRTDMPLTAVVGSSNYHSSSPKGSRPSRKCSAGSRGEPEPEPGWG